MQEPKFIAELGVNYGGSLELAKTLVQAAARAKAHGVSIQIYNPHNISSNPEIVRKLEGWLLKPEEQREIAHLAKAEGLTFGVAVVDQGILDHALTLEPDFIKTVSGDLTNLTLLRAIAKSGRPHYLAVGGCEVDEIRAVLDRLGETSHLTLLHTTVNPPTPIEHLRLHRIALYKDTFGLPVGYGDHSILPGVCAGAVHNGASVVLKYFTNDRNSGVADSNISVQPDELEALVNSIRDAWRMKCGEPAEWTSKERETVWNVRRAAVTTRALPKGHRLTVSDVIYNRPGHAGMSALEFEDVVGKALAVDLEQGVPVKKEDISK